MIGEQLEEESRGLSAGPLGRFLLYVLRLRSFDFINVLLLYDMARGKALDLDTRC